MENKAKSPKLSFFVQEVMGSPVLCVETHERINRPLETGERLVVPLLFHTAIATVESVTERTATAHSGRLVCFLTWEKEPRHCWVCTSSGDLDALQQVNFV